MFTGDRDVKEKIGSSLFGRFGRFFLSFQPFPPVCAGLPHQWFISLEMAAGDLTVTEKMTMWRLTRLLNLRQKTPNIQLSISQDRLCTLLMIFS